MNIQYFDPNSPASNNNIFGLPFSSKNAHLVIIPIPWEVTVSFNSGTSLGPEKVLEASYQVDLLDADVPDAWKLGVAMEKLDKNIIKKNKAYRKLAEKYIEAFTTGQVNQNTQKDLKKINTACHELKEWLFEKSNHYFKKGIIPVVLGGDHSTPLGLIEAVSKNVSEFTILHIDAHYDLRKAYEGFEYSHASIMYNALKNCANIKNLVHVGIRDYCEEEVQQTQKNKKSITFFDQQLKESMYNGKTWDTLCNEIIKQIKTEAVYISFDIDGLDPKLCPGTGTPVAGGLEFYESIYLLKKLIQHKKRIVAFDLNEVASHEQTNWDGNVGARLLYKLCNLTLQSQKQK